MKRVTIVQRVLPHYRLAFFTRLREALEAESIDLQLVYGQERPGSVPRTVPLTASWAHRVENRYLEIGGRELVWQPTGPLSSSDLVVVEQANRMILNYLLLARRSVRGRPRIAYWGHGRSFQARSGSLTERLKASLARRVDWWFAYTSESARIAIAAGAREDRVTIVDNAIDTSELQRARQAIAPATARAELGISADATVGVFCGGLQPAKNLGFLLRACERIRGRDPRFELIVVGDGPSRAEVDAAASRHPWIHPVGEHFRAERARYFAAADVMLMPANIGLAVLDSFATQTPVITTTEPSHGPESAYLVDGVNAVIAPYDLDAYVDSVVRNVADPGKLAAIRAGCLQGARRYTLDHMVSRFSSGVTACLAS